VKETIDIYKDMVNNANSIIIRWDTSLRFTFINRFAQDFFGYSAEEVLGKSIIGMIVPETGTAGQDLAGMMKDIIDHPGQYISNVHENVRRNGERVWISWTNRPIVDGDGRVVEILAVGNDITALKRAEEGRRAREAELSSIFRAAPVGIGRVVDRVIAAANDRLCEMTGYAREELLGNSAWMLYPAQEDFDYVGAEKYRQIREKGTGTVETRWQRKDGRIIDVLLSSTPLDPAGSNADTTFTALDITERKRDEHALRESEEMQRAIFENAGSGIALCTPDGAFVRVNQKYCDIVGYGPDELARMNVLSLTYPEDVENEKEYVEGLFSGRRPLYTVEKRYVRKDGSLVWVNLTVTVIRDSAGKVTGAIGVIEDITERKRAEEALKSSEVKLKTMFEGASVAIYIADVETGVVLDCNSMAEKLIGRPRDEIIGMHQTQLHPPENSERHRDDFQRYARLDQISNYETEVQHRDGRKIPVILSGTPLDVEGKRIMIGFFLDNTERKRAEEALRSSQSMLRLVMDNVPQGIFWKNKDSVYEGCNNAFARSVGLERPEDIVGLTDYDLSYTREQADSFREYDRMIMAIGEPRFHIIEQFLHASGYLGWADTNKIPLRDAAGNIVGILGTYEDITERKRAEEALRESEAKYRELVENANSMIVHWGMDGNILFFNEYAEAFFGYAKDEVIGKNILGTLVPPTDTAGRDLAAMVEDIKRDPDRYRTNVNENVRRSGERVWVSWTNKALRDRQGNVFGILAVGNDITGLIRANEATRKAKAEAELYVDVMGHDITNINQAILGYLELASELLDLKGSEKELLTRPMDLLGKSSGLISNVKKLRKLGAGASQLSERDLGEAIERAVALNAVRGRDVRIDYEPARGYSVMADDMLVDVFSNLVENAIEHSTGPLAVDIKVSRISLDGESYCRVSIEDNGPGIPDNAKQHVLDRLSRFERRATRRGMGLCLTRELVESYHGKISVENRVPGDHTQGAKFVVLLPAMKA
jgi:PAS domain S-box-containing protein